MVDRAYVDRACQQTRAAVAEMGGPFFAARAPGLNPPWFGGGGTSNGVQTSMKVRAPGTGRVRDVTVVTMVNERPRTEETILRMRLGSDLPEPPVFPATSTVHRGKVSMRVVGRRRLVTIYLCGGVLGGPHPDRGPRAVDRGVRHRPPAPSRSSASATPTSTPPSSSPGRSSAGCTTRPARIHCGPPDDTSGSRSGFFSFA